MNIAIVLMKGFDGCGVSRFAIEHQRELRESGHTCDVYSFDNKYARSRAHDDADVKYYKKFRDVDFSSYDIFVLNSYEQEFLKEDLEYYKSLKCYKVAMMHEILRQNVSRISNIWDWLDASDVVSSFSNEMDFVKDLRQNLPGKNYFPFKMAMSDKDMSSLYNKSLASEKKDRLVYFGRWTTMKDPHRLYEYKQLDPSYDFKMIGVERSIGAYHDIFTNELCEAVKLPFLETMDQFTDFYGDDSKVQVFPPVNRLLAMDILSESKYGCSFYHLKNNRINNLGNRMEYAQIELSCVCLPVFDEDWGKNTIDVVTGKSFYDLGDNAIYSNTEDLESSLNEMKNMTKEEYDRRRKNIFDLVVRNYGSADNIKYFYDTVNKFKSGEMKNNDTVVVQESLF